MRVTPLFIVIAFVAYACSAPDQACEERSDCDSGMVCVDRVCALLCDRETACGANQVCRDGVCESAVCGDSLQEAQEQCDNGANNADSAACTSSCALARCGDGLTYAGVEECDDANTADGDGCTNSCTFPPRCGDGTLTAPEQCDDGNTSNTDACPTTCRAAYCGDTFVRAGVEDCDDGNPNNTDSCLSDCTGARCGDGYVRSGIEDCDDGSSCADGATVCTSDASGCVGIGDGSCAPRNADGCAASCAFEPGFCWIAGYPYLEGTINPDNPCSECRTGLNVFDWSNDDSNTCTDNNLCSTGDYCTEGACLGAGALGCADGNVCTNDSCDPALGCQYSDNDGAPCGDSSNTTCTGPDTCLARVCRTHHVPNQTPCDDANAATCNDHCTSGACGGTPVCPGGNICVGRCPMSEYERPVPTAVCPSESQQVTCSASCAVATACI